MPYTRRTMTKKTYQKKPYRKPVMVNSRSVAALVKKVTLKQAETKKYEFEQLERSINSLTSPTTVWGIAQVPVGNQYSQRIGHEITGVGFNIRGHVTVASGRCQYVRIIAFRVKNAGTNNISELLENNGGNQTAVGDMETMWRRVNTEAFEVLGSRILKVGDSQEQSSDRTKMFKMWIPYKRAIRYDGSSTIDPVQPIKFIVFNADANNDSSGGDSCEVSFNSTFYFKDM